MKSLKEYLTLVTQDKNYFNLESTQEFLGDLDNLHLFKIDLTSLGTKDVTEDDIPKNLSIPFENCWFDLSNMVSTKVPNDIEGGTVEQVVFNGFCVREVTPSYHRLIALAGVKYKGTWYSMPFNVSLFEGGKIGMGASEFKELYEFMSHNILIVAKEIERKLQEKHFTIVNNDEKLDIKSRVGRTMVRYKYKPNRVIYVSNIQDFKTNHPELKSKIIRKPEYSWEVMGHWRRLINPNTLGKNRKGEYIVEGWTYVMPYVKGTGELMKKVRVIK